MEIRAKPTGKPVLYLKGYAYFRDNDKADRIYWRCTRKKHLCSARAVSLKEPDGTPVYVSESNKCIQHSHPPSNKPLSAMVVSGNVLHHDGFSYYTHHQNQAMTRRIWRCQRTDCRGLILSRLGQEGKVLDANLINDHNHASDQRSCSICLRNRKQRGEVIYASTTHKCGLSACNIRVHKACGKLLERNHGSQRSLVFCRKKHRNLFLQLVDDTPSDEPAMPARVDGAGSDVESSDYIQSGGSDGNSGEDSGDDQQTHRSDTLGKRRRKTKRPVSLDTDEEELEENPNSDEEEGNSVNSEEEENLTNSEEEENPVNSEEEGNPDNNDELDASDDDQDMEDNDMSEDRDMEEARHTEQDVFRKPTVEYAAPSSASTSSFDATNGKRYARPTPADFQTPRTGRSTGVGSSERSDEGVPRALPAQPHSAEPSTSSSGISAAWYAQDDAEGSASSGPAMPASRPDWRKAGAKRPATRRDAGGGEGDGAAPEGDLHREYFQSKIRKNDLIFEKTKQEMALMEEKRKQERAREEILHQLAVQKLQKEIELLEDRRKNEAERARKELALLEGQKEQEEERERTVHQLRVNKVQKEIALLEGETKRQEQAEKRGNQHQQLLEEKTRKELELLSERSRRETEKAAQERERYKKLREMSELEATESRQRQAWYEHCTRQ